MLASLRGWKHPSLVALLNSEYYKGFVAKRISNFCMTLAWGLSYLIVFRWIGSTGKAARESMFQGPRLFPRTSGTAAGDVTEGEIWYQWSRGLCVQEWGTENHAARCLWQASAIWALLQNWWGALSVQCICEWEFTHIYLSLCPKVNCPDFQHDASKVGWGGEAEPMQESFPSGMKWSISPVASSSLLEIPIQFNIKHSQSSVVKTSD